jgi:hypothetical protein
MCGSPCDYCVPGYLDREADYRGCDPAYRAGSVFYSSRNPYGDEIPFANTGNFGTTVPIAGTAGPTKTIGRPETSPDLLDGFEGLDNGETPPNIDEILKGTKGTPVNKWETPAPKTPAPGTIETMPFTTPEILPVPPAPIPATQLPIPNPPLTGTPDITIEELRKLDPTVTDIKILNIEDTAPGVAVPNLTPRK